MKFYITSHDAGTRYVTTHEVHKYCQIAEAIWYCAEVFGRRREC